MSDVVSSFVPLACSECVLSNILAYFHLIQFKSCALKVEFEHVSNYETFTRPTNRNFHQTYHLPGRNIIIITQPTTLFDYSIPLPLHRFTLAVYVCMEQLLLLLPYHHHHVLHENRIISHRKIEQMKPAAAVLYCLLFHYMTHQMTRTCFGVTF
jgi:hypothetical protein